MPADSRWDLTQCLVRVRGETALEMHATIHYLFHALHLFCYGAGQDLSC